MTIFKLKNFPNVCRMCLQVKPSAEMISLDSYRPLFSLSIIEMLEQVSVKIPLKLSCYLPNELCEQCLDVFEFFYKYKRKLDLIQRFSGTLAEVKAGDEQPLIELFAVERDSLQVLFKDLDLCDRENVQAEELLEEFYEYDIASTICVKIESASEYSEDEGGSEAELDEMELAMFKEDGSANLDAVLDSYMEELHKSMEADQEIEPDGDAIPDGLQEELVASVVEEEAESEVTMLEKVGDDDDEEGMEYIDESDVDIGDVESERPVKRRKYTRLPEEEVELQVCNLDCKFSSTFPSLFEKHLIKSHSDQEGVLSCHRKSCNGELFDSIDLLRQHKNDAHFTHICDDCGKVTKHLVALENHRKLVHGRGRDPALQCTVCEDRFRSEAELQRHTLKVHAMRFTYECPECGLGFRHKLLLTQHVLSHSDERNFNCEQCDNTFKTANHLRRHIRTVHTEVRYPCEHCPVSYGRKDKLRMHMERVHEIQTYFTCDICCVTFPSNGKLEEHKQRHEKPEDLECGICLTACPNAEEFNDHLCISYQNDYVCCRRDFRYHSYYNRHMFLAHGVHTNARVKPKTGVLMGKQRAMRKAVERCPKCEHVFPSRKTKKAHMETCEGQVVIFEIEPVADVLCSTIVSES